MAGQNISRFPLGLLSFLGIQADGRYPPQLADAYIPTADVLQWMLQSQPTYARFTPVTLNANTNAQEVVLTWNAGSIPDLNGNALVPNNEVWAILNAEVRGSWTGVPGVGTVQYGCSLLYRPRGAILDERAYPLVEMEPLPGDMTVVTARSSSPMRRMVFVPPGTLFNLLHGGLVIGAAPTFQFQAGLSIVRMRV